MKTNSPFLTGPSFEPFWLRHSSDGVTDFNVIHSPLMRDVSRGICGSSPSE